MPRKRIVPPSRAVDHALKLAATGWSKDKIDEALGFQSTCEAREVSEIADNIIEEIARVVFGAAAKVKRIEQLHPLVQYGIQRRGGFTGNLVYSVVMDRPRQHLVFRFNRGQREDVYFQERENYALVQSVTGIRGPNILHIDRSRSVAPSEYMVMEFIEGELAGYLAHPNNPELNDTEKQYVRRATGRFYAALHNTSRPARDHLHEMRRLLFGLYRLKEVAASASTKLDLLTVQGCIEAFESATVLHSDTESFCFADGELLFRQQAGRWEPTYVCDLEWTGHRDRYADLVMQLSPATPLWSLSSPGISATTVHAARSDPFFNTYQLNHDVDWERLNRLVVYYQLALWGHAIADQLSTPALDGILDMRGRLLNALMQEVLNSSSYS